MTIRRTPSLQDYVATCRAEIDRTLERVLATSKDCPALLADAMRYSVFAGGKRFRPILSLAAAETVTEAGRAADAVRFALPAACAIEMIHTYSLIHDDLPAMDNDTLRRGKPTLHVLYGDGLAILAGDGLLAEAFTLLAHEPETTDPDLTARKLRVVRAIAGAAGAGGMVGGQAVDLHASNQIKSVDRLTLDAAGLKAMHARKTGALIRASAVSGAIMGGGDDRQVAGIDRYASELGLAFQIVDDLLDVEGASQELGKTTGKDEAAGKPTYPALFGVERSRQLAQETLHRALEALESIGAREGRLAEIAHWVVARTS